MLVILLLLLFLFVRNYCINVTFVSKLAQNGRQLTDCLPLIINKGVDVSGQYLKNGNNYIVMSPQVVY